MPRKRLPNTEIKRCMISAYVSNSIVDYLNNTTRHSGISKSEAMRNFIPTSTQEWLKYIKMVEDETDTTDNNGKSTIICYVTESEYDKIKKAQLMCDIISTNEFFETIFSKKMKYLIKQAHAYKNKNHKRYKPVVFHTTKASSNMLEAGRVEYNKNHNTNYSKSRFLIMLANGQVESCFDCTGFEGKADTTITLNFYPSDLEVFKARYGGKSPNSDLLRSILSNSIRQKEEL